MEEDALCDICGKPASAHFHATAGPGREPLRWHLCDHHAQLFAQNYRPGPNPAVIAAKVNRLVRFMKEHQRTPTRSETEEMGGSGSMPFSRAGEPDFERFLAYFESIISYIEKNNSFPGPEDIGEDPFERR